MRPYIWPIRILEIDLSSLKGKSISPDDIELANTKSLFEISIQF